MPDKNKWVAVLFFLSLAASAQPKPRRLGIGKAVVARPEEWKALSDEYPNAAELYRLDSAGKAAHALITWEEWPTHGDALSGLGDIADESGVRTSFRVFKGWVTIRRESIIDTPQRGNADEQATPAECSQQKTRVITLALAMDRRVLRIEISAPFGTKLDLDKEIRSFSDKILFASKDNQAQHDTEKLLKRWQLCCASAPSAGGPPSTPPPSPHEVINVQSGIGETTVAISTDGQFVLVATNAQFSLSSDRGRSFPFQGSLSWKPPEGTFSASDHSLAWGGSGAFYHSVYGHEAREADADHPGGQGWCGVHVFSGKPEARPTKMEFRHAGYATRCADRAGAPGPPCSPDQPHIASDRGNHVAGHDQLYAVWRKFSGTDVGSRCEDVVGNKPVAVLACSTDSGEHWGLQRVLAGDFPRVTVGPDGNVWTVQQAGSSIVVQSFKSCADKLEPTRRMTVARCVKPVTCPVPGLDRCNNGNNLASPTVAIDQDKSDHVFVAYAKATNPSNEDVILIDSRNGGKVWSRSVRVNAEVPARRFMPWMCTVGSVARVGWYDRRHATADHNDVTSYYLGGATVSGGTLQSIPEAQLNAVDDWQCEADWSIAPRCSLDSDRCRQQPKYAGDCTGNGPGCVQGKCDFSDYDAGSCSTGGGVPKFGDYNEIGCGAAYVFAAWTSTMSSEAGPGAPRVHGIPIDR